MAKSYLKKVATNYHFRIRIPLDLRPILGQTELRKTLKTSDLDLAQHLSQIYAYEAGKVFESLRIGGSMFFDLIPGFTSLKFAKLNKKADGSIESEGVELDPNNLEADAAVLCSILDIQPTSISPANKTLLSDLIETYCEEKKRGGRWKPKTEDEYRASYTLLLDYFGDVEASTITAQSVASYKKVLMQLPKHHSKGIYEGLSIPQILKLKPDNLLDPTTINKRLQHASSLFKYAVKEGLVDQNHFAEKGIAVNKRDDELRDVWTEAELKILFGSEHFTDGRFRHNYQYWVPLIGLFTGMRLDEICQLYLEDICEIDGIWCFDVNDACDKKLKNPKAARRIVPIHSTLIEKNLLRYCEALQNAGEQRLFPEIQRRRDGYGQTVSKWFGRYREKLGLKRSADEANLDFHSFRHTATNEWKQRDVEHAKIQQLIGHQDESITTGRYGKRYSVDKLKPVIELLDFSVVTNSIKPF